LWKLNGNAAAHQLPEGDYVVLTIADEGAGMSEEVRRRATEPFFTTKGQDRGTGLGLAMVHGFVQQSLGRLELESAPGDGTQVRMLFPVATEESQRPLRPAPRQGGGRAAAHGTETILLVEDSDDVRALAAEVLGALGYRIVLARSGEEALEMQEKETIDLLFTDIVMPGGMSGLELVERFASIAPGVPVLMTTGYNEDLVADIPRGTALDVIGKPYRREELADRVRMALDRRTEGERSQPRDYGHKEG